MISPQTGLYNKIFFCLFLIFCLTLRILKICTGDLVNKGPKSREVIEYFQNNTNCCLSVRGNHDEVILKEYQKYLNDGQILPKNEWIKQLTYDHIHYLSQLPYTISIPKLNIIVVHAGLLPNVELDQQNLDDLLVMRHLIEEQEGDKKVYKPTKSDKVGVPWAELWPGPDHVYFGHDAKKKLQEQPFATGLDTGAVYGFQLTAKFIMGPRKGQYVTMKSLKSYKPTE